MSPASAREDGRDLPRRTAAVIRGTLEREITSVTARSSRLHARHLFVSALAFAGLAASSATGATAPLPASPVDDTVVPAPVTPSPAPGGAGNDVPAPAAPAVAPAPAAKSVGLPLRVGVRGPLVKDMQRELRRRGIRLAVDGVYGRGTARAVLRMQRRFHLPANGKADARFLRRLGLQSLSTAGTTAPVIVTAVLPSWVRMEIWPTSGQVTSPFGARWGRAHEGIDIANNDAPPISAALPGRVTFAGWQDGYGNLVKLAHGNGLETRYGHMASIGVVKGDAVATGQQIGVMGSTGRSTGIHLHFEVRVGGTAFNPLAALPPRTP